MRFTLLGCGTSTGVPLPGCRCPVCTSTNPKNFRNRTSGVFTADDGFAILIDATPDLRHQALKFGVSRVDAVVYTHAHADHILGTDDLRSFNFVSRKRIPCYGTAATLAGLRKCFSYIFDSDPHYEGGLLAQLDPIEISNEDPFRVGDILVSPCELLHGRMAVTGLRIGDLGYATDFKRLTERARTVLHGARHLFLDGLRYEQHATHLTIDEAIEVSRELAAENTYIIHTTHSVDYDEVSAKLPSGVQLGYDGLTVEVAGS